MKFVFSVFTVCLFLKVNSSELLFFGRESCFMFNKKIQDASVENYLRNVSDERLVNLGYVREPSSLGTTRYQPFTSDTFALERRSHIHINAAQKYAEKYNFKLDDYNRILKKCLNLQFVPLQTHPKYRAINGYGNNLQNPEWGMVNTPFGRYIENRNFEDGIYEIKKSVTGGDLPNPRTIVQEILLKAVKSPPPAINFNVMAILLISAVTDDVHLQMFNQHVASRNGYRCCTQDHSAPLPKELQNSNCFPVEIPANDPFYKPANVRCLNMVRSQTGQYSDASVPFDVLNRATSFMDLSNVYGTQDIDSRAIRLFRDGKLRLGRNEVLTVFASGNYSQNIVRVPVPMLNIWSSLFARNHNHLAGRLAALNPSWDDETIFQEARRINIAIKQRNIVGTQTIETIFKQKVKEPYNINRKPATSLEFAMTYRTGHYYIQSMMSAMNENYEEKLYLISETIGKFPLIEDNFDDILRGATIQRMNTGQYSAELYNNFLKNSQGVGMDILSFDIQRGRDNGLASFLEVRRKCNLTPVINTFDDFKLILNPANVEFLKNVYKSPEDVDFLVGGMLENFEKVGNPMVGPTFGCVIAENYRNIMGGDIYFYSHPENPYPFTTAQMAAIENFSFTQMYCINSKMKETNKLWGFAPHPAINPRVKCSDLPLFDLTAWKV